MIVSNQFREYEPDYTKVQSGIQSIQFSKIFQLSNGPEYDRKIHGKYFDHKGRLKHSEPPTQGISFNEILKTLNDNKEFRKYEITDDTLKEDYEVYKTFNQRNLKIKAKELPKFVKFNQE